MRAVIKGIFNGIFDVETYCAESVDNFYLGLRVRIELNQTQGVDGFELLICTPKCLKETVWEARWGRGLLIVRECNFSINTGLIHDYVCGFEGGSWGV